MKITRKNQLYSVECIKFCKNQDNVRIYLFKNLFPIAQLEYIVAVRKDADTLYFSHFRTLRDAFSSYLDNILKYA